MPVYLIIGDANFTTFLRRCLQLSVLKDAIPFAN